MEEENTKLSRKYPCDYASSGIIKPGCLFSELASHPIPFGHVCEASRRGYTVAQETFEQLRDECLRSGKLYEDPEFPTINHVFPNGVQNLEWRRPSELVPNPRFFVDAAKRFDIVQGDLGDCWLLAAVADLTLNEKLLQWVVPHDQGFTKEDKYCGIFHFRFWQFGQRVDVVIDDRLPTANGRLVFMHSSDNNVFWSALLEKAYAKVNGSYQSLKGGRVSEALEDFSGGLAEYYIVKDPKAPKNMFEVIMKSFDLWAMMACSIDARETQVGVRRGNGLVEGHAYSVTGVVLMEVKTPNPGKIPCLRLRNPWGAAEWNGDFSDGSDAWKFVTEDFLLKKKLKFTVAEDGEFWMPFTEVENNFDTIEICNLDPETVGLADESFVREHPITWQAIGFSGSWTKGVSAGGCHDNVDTFHLNPQYRITLSESDGADGEATCIIALMQKNRRKLRMQGLDLLTIGFYVYHLSDPKKAPTPLNREFFRSNSIVARSPLCSNSRQMTARVRLPLGDYCIIPATADPSKEGDFLLRTYSQAPVTMTEHDNQSAQIVHPTKPPALVDVKHREHEEEEMIGRFKKIAGNTMEIDAKGLSLIFNEALKTHFMFKGFSPEIVRSMMTMSDLDLSGKLRLEEFVSLWKIIEQWKDTFATYDKRNEGKIQMEHLREAIESAGYLVNSHVLRVIALRYGQPDCNITFENFILCIVRLRRMISIFQANYDHNLKEATFSFDDWLVNTMYT